MFVLVLFFAWPLTADWERLAPGIEFQKFRRSETNYYVARIDLTDDRIRVIGTQERDRGTSVSAYARLTRSIVAMNGDFFTDKLQPIGQAISQCGPWKQSADLTRPVVAIGRNRSQIYRPSELDSPTPAWAQSVVSGWPRLVIDCKALNATELPGSDRFTRTPLARTAVGLTDDGETMFFVVVEKRENISNGVTLADLAKFMKDELEACSAINLDGGGSAAMAIEGSLANQVTYAEERRVANHLAVVLTKDVEACDSPRAGVVAEKRMTDREFWNDLREILGNDGATQTDGTFRITWPRSDLMVMARGLTLDPAFAQTSWAGFRRRDSNVLVAGELVVTEGELQRVMDALRSDAFTASTFRHGLLQASPRLTSVYFRASGPLGKVAHAIRKALESTSTPLTGVRNGNNRKITFDSKEIDRILGQTGKIAGPVYQVTVPRRERILVQGNSSSASMGIASSIRLQSVADGHAIATGEFALLEQEVDRVVQALRGAGLTPGVPHSHFSETQPKLVFVEFWGDDDAAVIASALQQAVEVIVPAK